MPTSVHRVLSPFRSFVRSESFGGLLLVATATIAFIWANSPWAASYEALKQIPFGLEFGDWGLKKPLILWVNDLLMAIFFLLVGLEIKREVKVGELSDPQARALPVAAALGGMVVPALFYVAVNQGGEGMPGWGIPMATDIAFALGIMALLGPRVPIALKVFLTALAIVDDLGAVLVIAVFYTSEVNLTALGLSLGLWVAAWTYRSRGGRRLPVFLGIGIVMWYFMLKSGVHATVAGVLLAFTVPIRRLVEPEQLHRQVQEMFRTDVLDRREAELAYLEKMVDKAQSPLHNLEHGLQPWVAYVIMPVFALLNAGFTLGEGASLMAPVSLGAFLGLVIGKPLGVAGFAWVATKLGWASLPKHVNWAALTGTGLLSGIGFTMSLFIAALAFGGNVALDEQAKLGVLAASVTAALVGLVVLRFSLKEIPPLEDD
ncbi:MAG: Na+/H+ antiporter NhaA [Acidobacteriota bacterium]